MAQYRTYSVASVEHGPELTIATIMVCAEEGYSNRKRKINDRVCVRGIYFPVQRIHGDAYVDDARFYGTLARLATNHEGIVPGPLCRQLHRRLRDPEDASCMPRYNGQTAYFDLSLHEAQFTHTQLDLVKRVKEEIQVTSADLLDLTWAELGPEYPHVHKFFAQFPPHILHEAKKHNGAYRQHHMMRGGRAPVARTP